MGKGGEGLSLLASPHLGLVLVEATCQLQAGAVISGLEKSGHLASLAQLSPCLGFSI